MASPRARQRNNTIAGLFVLVTFIGFVVVVVVLSDLRGFFGYQEIEIWFPTDLGAPGLERGSAISLAGVQVGKVSKVELRLGGESPIGPHVLVTGRIPGKYVVRKDAKAGVVIPVIGGGSSINLEGLGSGEPLSPGEALRGEYAPSAILRSAGIGPQQIGEIQSIIRKMDAISADVSEITRFTNREISENGQYIVQRVREVVDRVAEVVDSVRGQWPEWAKLVTAMLENASAATSDARNLITDGREFVGKAGDVVDDVGQTVRDVQPQVKQTVDNVAEITERARTEWSERITRVLQSAETGVDQASSTVASLDDALTTELPQLRRTLANMRLASDNLKLAMIEIRNQPWRLLASPSERSIQETLLYDAVRTYASAVSDLDSSVASLQALHDRSGNAFDSESEAVRDLLSRIEQNLAAYNKAESALYEFVLKETGADRTRPGSPPSETDDGK